MKEISNIKESKIGDFFQTDIYTPSKYIPLAYDSCETGNGNMEYDVAIKNPELGIFNRMEIIIFQSTSVANVIFIANDGRVTDELMLFINLLVEIFGTDDHGKKELSKEDLKYLQRGFGVTRYWINHGISLDLNVDSTGEFEIIFYGIEIDSKFANSVKEIDKEKIENEKQNTGNITNSINIKQMLLDGQSFEKSNNIDEAIDIYLEITNKHVSDLRAYDRIIILYRKKKDYEKEAQLILQAILGVMILGSKDMDIEDIHKIWEGIVNDLTSRIVVRHDDCRIAYMDMDFKLKLIKYVSRYFSVRLLLQRRITKELSDRVRQGDLIAATPSQDVSIKNNEEEANVTDEESSYEHLEQNTSEQTYKKGVVYAILLLLLLLLVWLMIEYPWVILCVGIVALFFWSSASGSGGNVKGHRKKNGTYVSSYSRRTRR